jgi:transposase
MPYFGGLDWGGAGHAVCIVDGSGAVVLSLGVTHDASGLADLRKRLAKLAPASAIPIAIERPSGLIVDALLEAGHSVVPIHPNVVRACRPRYRAAGGKSDPGDAFMLADILRTDGHRFRPLTPCSDEIKALRALVRGRDDLVAERVCLANRLRSLLDSFWPGAAATFADIDSPIALAFVQRYSTPDSAARLGENRMKAFLASHAYCGRRSPAELLDRLRAAPTGRAGETEAEAKGEMVRALAAVLERLGGEIAKLTARIEHTIAELPDGQVVMSFPRAGRICAAQILAELGDVRDRFQTPRPARRRGRRLPRHPRLRQIPRRRLPMGLQPPLACCHHLLRRQLPPRVPVGRRRLQAGPRPRMRPSSCHPHPRKSLDTRPLASLDQSHPIQLCLAQRRRSLQPATRCLTQGVSRPFR